MDSVPGGWHDTAINWGMSTTQIISAVDNTNLDALPSAVKNIMENAGVMTVGIVPDLDINQ